MTAKSKPLPPLRSFAAPQFGPRHHFRHRSSSPDALPYGYWVLENGDEALFDRNYQMIWIRRPGCPAERADHIEQWTWNYMRFFHDITSHPRNKLMRRTLENTRQDFIDGGPLRAPPYVPRLVGTLIKSSPRPSPVCVVDNTRGEQQQGPRAQRHIIKIAKNQYTVWEGELLPLEEDELLAALKWDAERRRMEEEKRYNYDDD